MTISVGIAGASGYAGGELLRLLAGHPEFEVAIVSAGTNAGQQITALHPQLTQWSGAVFEDTDAARLNECDQVFLALPHGASASLAADLTSAKVVDLGADFRLQEAVDWAQYYAGSSPHAGAWPYGLPELVDRSGLAAASRIANPGCYATVIALTAAPLLRAELVDSEDLVVVAASGTSGAGRSAAPNLLGAEVMGSMSAYKVGGVHQHTPEIEQTLRSISPQPVRLSFTPLLAPMPRGILATLSAKLVGEAAAVREAFELLYADEPFVRLLPPGVQPRTGSVLGSNHCQLQVEVDSRLQRVTVTAVIDNLVKGAAGQAIQNANLQWGLAETTGLEGMGIAP